MHFQSVCLIALCLVASFPYSSEKLTNSKQLMKVFKYLENFYPSDATSIPAAVKFMRKVDEFDRRIFHDVMEASYNYDTNLTEYNLNKRTRMMMVGSQFEERAKRAASKFDWSSFEKRNNTLFRWFRIFIKEAAKDLQFRVYLTEPSLKSAKKQLGTMEQIFNEARVCHYRNSADCSLTLYPDVVGRMGQSRDPEELLSLWTQFRDQTGKKMIRQFIENIKTGNDLAKSKGFRDYSEVMTYDYEEEHFKDDMAQVMKEIAPLYRELHAYVRRKIRKYYKDVKILPDGPIPAHLLGDLYAQTWITIFDIVNPFPEKRTPNITKHLIKKKMKPIDMFMIAEKFFTSMGFESMTPYFWHYSMIEKPPDRDVVCNGFAVDFMDGLDYRIRMCTEATSPSLNIVHHEMGHIVYYMQYKHLPKLFRDGANYGFHEAVGEVSVISASTTEYFNEVLFDEEEEFDDDEETFIIFLMQMALRFIPTVPYAYIIDAHRYKVYSGSTKVNELNRSWWKYRLKYQGVCPPVRRTEEDFDPGAKNHIAKNIEYMRYFYATVLAFQMHKALCDEAGHRGPLSKCNIYKSKEAGRLLMEVLSVGKSKSPQEVFMILTRGRTTKLQSEPYLEYFQPLYEWLKRENQGKQVGWKSCDPMACPTARTAKECRRKTKKKRQH